MRFTPKTEAEIASDGLWPPGEYVFEVHDAKDDMSKNGNEMIALTIHVHNDAGDRTTLFDYLVATEKAAFKIRHFATATGLLPKYEAGELSAADCVGRAGRCKISILKDKTGQYPDKNAIADYLRSTAAAAAPARRPLPAPRAAAPVGDLDDEIPF